MHKPIVVNLPSLVSSAYCPCGYQGKPREGERAQQTASIDALAHFESELTEQWAREASSLASILHCPLCKSAMNQDPEEGWAECTNHIFRMQDTRRATVLTLANDHASTLSGLVVDLSWDNTCPVVNCPGILLDYHSSNLSDDTNVACPYGHSFEASVIPGTPFLVCELIF